MLRRGDTDQELPFAPLFGSMTQMDYQPLSIRKILDAVISGSIRVPAFQRAFVWEMDRVAYLMDSIYKDYPIGSLLFWRTKEQLTIERNLGNFLLPAPREEYPIDYVLDGQQRLTSIFTVFQTELAATQANNDWLDIYFDFLAPGDAQDSQFFALLPEQFNVERHFPLKVLFDSVKYREATAALPPEHVPKIDALQEQFKEALIPIQVLKTEERSRVAIVFERINRLGMELDTLQLLAAWTWNEDFDLLESFRELKEELEDFGFSAVGEDTNLILRCTSAILAGKPNPEELLKLNGQEVRRQFPLVSNGIKGAIDFLRREFHVAQLKNLPYPALLIALSVFFAEPDGKDVVYNGDVLASLKKWFWKTCFTNRYNSQPMRTIERDIHESLRLKNGTANELDKFDAKFNSTFFSKSSFRFSNASTKTFILMLVQNSPKGLLSGSAVDLEKVLMKYNRSQFHHLYPKAFLKSAEKSEEETNKLANFCILSGSENRKISAKKPSQYITMLPASPAKEAILGSHFCEESDFGDNYDKFIESRSARLIEFAMKLI